MKTPCSARFPAEALVEREETEKRRQIDGNVKNEKRRIHDYGNALRKSRETGLGRMHCDLWKGACEMLFGGSQSLARCAETYT